MKNKENKFRRCHKCNEEKKATKMWEVVTKDLKTAMLCNKCAKEYFNL